MSGCLQWWTEEFAVVLAEKSGIPDYRLAVCEHAEKLLDLARWRVTDVHFCGRRTDRCEGVRDFARRVHRIAWFELNAFFPDLNENLALNDVKPLFLVVMQMQRRSARKKVRVLEEEEVAARLLRGDLERNAAETKRAVLALDVLACQYDAGVFDRKIGWLGVQNDGLREREWKGESRGFEKVPTFQIESPCVFGLRI